MKLKFTLTISLLSLGLAAARAQDVKLNIPGKADQPAAPAAAPAKPAYTEAQLVEEFGWFIGKRVGLTELEFSQSEIDLLLTDGTRLTARHDSGIPAPDTADQGRRLEAKFVALVEPILGAAKTQALLAEIGGLERLADVRGLMAMCAG